MSPSGLIVRGINQNEGSQPEDMLSVRDPNILYFTDGASYPNQGTDLYRFHENVD